MSSQIALQCLPVADFFAQINWQGLAIAPTQVNTKTSRTVSPSIKRKKDFTSPQILCLSVGEFFGLHNWQGEVIDDYDDCVEAVDESIETIDFSLTLPVQQFFALVAWDGRSKLVASSVEIPVKLPESTPRKTLIAATVGRSQSNAIATSLSDMELNVNDLSSLF
jgi:hypothetical protein